MCKLLNVLRKEGGARMGEVLYLFLGTEVLYYTGCGGDVRLRLGNSKIGV
jgi:hypothetical protein